MPHRGTWRQPRSGERSLTLDSFPHTEHGSRRRLIQSRSTTSQPSCSATRMTLWCLSASVFRTRLASDTCPSLGASDFSSSPEDLKGHVVAWISVQIMHRFSGGPHMNCSILLDEGIEDDL